MADESLRIQRLEQSVRVWKIATCSFVGLPCLFFALGAGQIQDKEPDNTRTAEALRARSIEIVNDKGIAVCSITSDLAGSGVIHVKYGNGTPLFSVAQGDFNQAGLTVFSKRGQPSAILREGDVGGGMLKLLSKQMNTIVIAGATKNNDGVLMVRSSDGKQTKEIGPR